MRNLHVRPLLFAFASGLVFALGLGVAGMTQPSKVIGFLDVFGGHWDPSLAFVMLGAIAVHLPLYGVYRRRAGATDPVGTCGPIVHEGEGLAAKARAVDVRLVVGAAILGVGWGLGGYCPGPAVVSAISTTPGVLIFVGAMLATMLLHPQALVDRSEHGAPLGAPSSRT